MSVTAEQIVRAAQLRQAPLTPETAGYLVLGLVDRLGPGVGCPDVVRLGEDGGVTVTAASEGTPEAAETRARELLGRLLSVAAGRSPALSRVAAGPPRGDGRLGAELEAALVPVNRAAARRALVRLHRDVSRVSSSEAAPAPAAGAVAEVPPPGSARWEPAPVPAQPLAPRPRATEDAAVAPSPRGVATAPLVTPAVAPATAAPAVPAPVVRAPTVVVQPSPPPGRVERTPVVGPAGLVVEGPRPHVSRELPRGTEEAELTPFLGSFGAVAPRVEAVVAPRPSESWTPAGGLTAVAAPPSPDPDTERQPPAEPLDAASPWAGPTHPQTPQRSPAFAAIFAAPVASPSPPRGAARAAAPVAAPASQVAPQPSYRPRQSDVSELLSHFEVAGVRSLSELSRDLTALVSEASSPRPPAVGASRPPRSR